VKETTFLWLSKGDLKGETESEIIAPQYEALQTKYHATKILQTERDSKRRLCKQFDETLNTSYQHTQYWQKNNTQRHEKCVLNYTVTYARK
jgi:hypothetical protein